MCVNFYQECLQPVEGRGRVRSPSPEGAAHWNFAVGTKGEKEEKSRGLKAAGRQPTLNQVSIFRLYCIRQISFPFTPQTSIHQLREWIKRQQ